MNNMDASQFYRFPVQFSLLPGPDWYEKLELLEAIRVYGFTMTESQFDDWIERGLVGQAHRKWLGRGQGSVSRWPSQQLALLIQLLLGRQQKVPISNLCVIPIWTWLYQGTFGGVLLPQVRRAMGTWVSSAERMAADTLRNGFRSEIEELQGTKATGKRALLKELMDIGALYKDADAELLRHYLESVVTDSPFHELKKNSEIFIDDIDLMAWSWSLRFKGIQHYQEQIATFPDAIWEWARIYLLYLNFKGKAAETILLSNQRLANRYGRLTVSKVMKKSGIDLLLALSGVEQKLFPEIKRDPTPFLNPLVWQDGHASASVGTTLVPSPETSPDGRCVAYLRNMVCIVYQEKAYQFTLDLPYL